MPSNPLLENNVQELLYVETHTEYSAGSGIDITDNVISLDPNVSAAIDNKLDTSSFSSYSATIDDELQYVSANAGKTYSGIAPIVVNNTTNEISADTQDISFGVGLDFTGGVLSVTAQGGDPEVENVVKTNSGVWNEVSSISSTSSVLNNQITALRDDLITVSTNTGYLYNDIQTTSGILSGAIDYVSANAGDEFPASANDAITAYQTYSGTYLTAHQPISSNEWNSVYETVETNSGAWGGTSFPVSADEAIQYIQTNSGVLDDTLTSYQTNSGSYIKTSGFDQTITNGTQNIRFGSGNNAGIFLSGQFSTAYYKDNELKLNRDGHQIAFNIGGKGVSILGTTTGSIQSQITLSNTAQSGNYRTDGITFTNSTGREVVNVKSIKRWNDASSTYQPIGDYLTNADSANFYPMVGNPSGFISGVDLTDYQTKAGMTAYQPVGDYATTGDLYNTSSTLSGAIDYISGNAGTTYTGVSPIVVTGNTISADSFDLNIGSGLAFENDTLYVSAQAGDPEVESYVQTNSGKIDDAVSSYQTNSSTYITNNDLVWSYVEV